MLVHVHVVGLSEKLGEACLAEVEPLHIHRRVAEHSVLRQPARGAIEERWHGKVGLQRLRAAAHVFPRTEVQRRLAAAATAAAATAATTLLSLLQLAQCLTHGALELLGPGAALIHRHLVLEIHARVAEKVAEIAPRARSWPLRPDALDDDRLARQGVLTQEALIAQAEDVLSRQL